jgi:hypothetical protein
VRQPPGIALHKHIGGAHRADHQHDVLLEKPAFEMAGRDQLPQQVTFDVLPFLDACLVKDIRYREPALDYLDTVIVALAGDCHRLVSCPDLGLPLRPEGDVHRLEVGRVLQPANLFRRLGRFLDRVREAQQVTDLGIENGHVIPL